MWSAWFKELSQQPTGLMYNQLEFRSGQELVEQYAPLVKRIAYHLMARLPSTVILDDLIQAGMLVCSRR